MRSLEDAILRTVLYADVFDFALTLPELHYFLIYHESVSQNTIENLLKQSSRLQQHLCIEHGYIVLAHRPELINRRIAKENITQKLDNKARRYGRILALIPFVRMVALTGALAARNPNHDDDDFDYLLITEPGRVWLARAFTIVVVRISRFFGARLCPNYVLAKDQLEQNKRDLFMAHEIAQMSPIVGQTLYQEMLFANMWASDYLPNIQHTSLYAQPTHALTGKARLFQQLAEILLRNSLADRIERWEYERKRKKFAREQSDLSSAEIGASKVKGHFYDHGQRILSLYAARLRDYGLDEKTRPNR